MAGETAHFNLRNREPTPAVRPFDVSPRLKAMLDGAQAALAEPFRGIAEGSEIVPGLFAPERTGVSLASLLEAARFFLAALAPKQYKAACFAIEDMAWRSWSNIHPWLMRHGVCLVLSPVILVEFDQMPGIVYDNDTPSRDHIHTVVRTPNGNDYGKDLLRQHYAQHDHSHPMTAHRQSKL